MWAASVTAGVIAPLVKLCTLGLSRRGRVTALAHVRRRITPVRAINTGRGRFRATIPSRRSAPWINDFHEYEPDTLGWIDEFPEGAVLWDIGANLGLFSLYAALRPDVRALAFEPASASYAALNENIKLNGMADRIQGYCLAFAAGNRLDFLNMNETEAGTYLHGFGTERDQLGRLIETSFRQGAVGFAIDDFVRFFSPPLPTHVKIDVDGIEADILRGGRKTLGGPNVRSMIIEIEGNPESPRVREIFSLIDELGFRPQPKASTDYRNVIFVR